MRRMHIALAVERLDDSVEDYSQRLGAPPTVVVEGQYAMWRTDTLNFSVSELPEQAGQLRHLGFEDDDAEGFTSETDVNGIVWERFSPTAQDDAIVEIYGPVMGAPR